VKRTAVHLVRFLYPAPSLLFFFSLAKSKAVPRTSHTLLDLLQVQLQHNGKGFRMAFMSSGNGGATNRSVMSTKDMFSGESGSRCVTVTIL
jgi:hypothetical protein